MTLAGRLKGEANLSRLAMECQYFGVKFPSDISKPGLNN